MKVYRDPLLKMVHNPGGHWNPVRGPHPRDMLVSGRVNIFLRAYIPFPTMLS